MKRNEIKTVRFIIIIVYDFTYLFDWLESVHDINVQFQHEPLEHCGHTSS